MADNKDAGVPALQDPSTSDNVCPTCQGLAIMITNSTTNQCDNSDSDDSSLSSVGHLIIHENPATPSDSSDSAYEADTIIDSPNSRSSTLKLNVSDSSNDETMLSDTNLNDEEIKEEPAPSMPRRPIISRITVLFGAGERGKTFKPLIDCKKSYRNLIGSDIVSNVDSNDSDDSMPPLEGSDPEIKDPKWQQRSKGNHTLPPLNQEEKLCVQNGCVCKCHGFKFGKGLSSDSLHEEKEETKEDSEEKEETKEDSEENL